MSEFVAALANKFKRNLEDYGAWVVTKKILAQLLAPLFLRRVYRLYWIAPEQAARKQDRLNGIEIRQLNPGDTEAIAQIENQAEWLRGELETRIAAGSLCMAAFRGENVAGFNLVSFGRVYIPLIEKTRHFRPGTAWSDHVAVMKDFRKLGLGSELRFRVCQELKSRGIKKLYGGTLRSNHGALKLMRRVGFSELADVTYTRIIEMQRWEYTRLAREEQEARMLPGIPNIASAVSSGGPAEFRAEGSPFAVIAGSIGPRKETERAPRSDEFRVFAADFRSDPRWTNFVRSHKDGLIYHHASWLGALEAEYGGKCVALACEDAQGRYVGILPLLKTRGLPLLRPGHPVGPRLSSLPRTPIAGPLSDSDEVTIVLVNAAIEYVKREPGLQLELKSCVPDLDKEIEGLLCMRWRDTYVRGLPENELSDGSPRTLDTHFGVPSISCGARPPLRFGDSRNNQRVKWAVNKAMKLGSQMRESEDEEDLAKWYRLYLLTMRRNLVPARPYRFFQSLWKEMRPGGQMSLMVSELKSERFNRIIGGSIVLRYGDTAFWAFTGCDENDFLYRCNDLMLWHCMQDSYRSGYRWFDLGEVAETHPELGSFKGKWDTVQKPMYRYYYPSPRQIGGSNTPASSSLLSRTARTVWELVPLKMTAVIGDWVYSFL
jgi:GNAT superfamily N-acetyltransferase